VIAGLVGVVALLAAGIGLGFALDSDDTVDTTADPQTVDTNVASTDDEPADAAEVEMPPPVVDEDAIADGEVEPVTAVAAAVAPSVVRIDTQIGLGSGIVYDADGLIVTNAHVVNGARTVNVRLADGTRVSGTVVGSAPAVDVAVVRIDDPDIELVPAVFAPSDSVRLGQGAVAIGSPFGLDQSVTAGVISSVSQVVENVNVADGTPTVVEMLQTDAPINPGNSGGALADLQGRIVGMNTAIRTDGTVEGNLGVGFAIPSDTVLLLAERITSGGSLESGFLGVNIADPTTGRPGALVTAINPASPAEAAGLAEGDLVVALDGEPVLGRSELAAKVRLAAPGDEITVTVEREGTELELVVTLGALGSG
jgi:putative serine protease PepD